MLSTDLATPSIAPGPYLGLRSVSAPRSFLSSITAISRSCFHSFRMVVLADFELRKSSCSLGVRAHTGSSAFLRPSPALSTSMPMYGPTTGSPRAKPAMVPRKSPNRTKIPYSSTKKPMNVHRMRISARPTKNAAVPLAFCFRAKKRRVFCGPMMIVRPMRKRIWCVRVVSWTAFSFRRQRLETRSRTFPIASLNVLANGCPSSLGAEWHSHGAIKEQHHSSDEEQASCERGNPISVPCRKRRSSCRAHTYRQSRKPPQSLSITLTSIASQGKMFSSPSARVAPARGRVRLGESHVLWVSESHIDIFATSVLGYSLGVLGFRVAEDRINATTERFNVKEHCDEKLSRDWDFESCLSTVRGHLGIQGLDFNGRDGWQWCACFGFSASAALRSWRSGDCLLDLHAIPPKSPCPSCFVDEGAYGIESMIPHFVTKLSRLSAKDTRRGPLLVLPCMAWLSNTRRDVKWMANR